MIKLRPDNRPSEVVWNWFEKEWNKGIDYPSVSWALGSDWGVGRRYSTPAEYKEVAYKLMVEIYGSNDSVEADGLTEATIDPDFS